MSRAEQIKAVNDEDMALMGTLAQDVQDKMNKEYEKMFAGDADLVKRAADDQKMCFDKADANKDGKLDWAEWIEFTAVYTELAKSQYGDSPMLNEAQMKARFDLTKKAGTDFVTLQDLNDIMAEAMAIMTAQ